MHWRVGLLACVAATALAALPVRACLPMPPDPPLPGESDAAYKVRTEALQRERTATWLKERQADALQRADAIFVARDIDWWPPEKPRLRNGRPLLPRPIVIPYPAPSWYKPIDWFRGTPSRGLFRVDRTQTDCGAMSIGDTTFSQTGNLFIFFAHKGPLSQRALIDAIAVDRINDPALMEFVAKYRGKSPPVPALPQ